MSNKRRESVKEYKETLEEMIRELEWHIMTIRL